MAFGLHDRPDEGDDAVMSEINMTPLVDVMLVLLIIFIITVPIMKHAVEVQLPQASTQRQELQPQTILLSVDAQGQYYWNATPLDDAALKAQLQAAAAQTPPPALHIQGDRAVRYERVVQLMAAARQAGLVKIGFVTEPQP